MYNENVSKKVDYKNHCGRYKRNSISFRLEIKNYYHLGCKILENNLVLNASKRMKLQQFPWQYVAIVNYKASVHLASFQYQ